MLSVTKKVFFDKNIIKIFDCIAGAGKSTYINEFYKKYNVDYVKYCATNQQKRDSDNRFNSNNDTIAGGLFINNGFLFYIEEKDPICKEVVIDEVLQSNIKIIDWVNNHVGKYNIVILTDSRQMLSADIGKLFLKKFKDLMKQDNVKVFTNNITLRARNEKTKNYIEKCYKSVNDENNNIFSSDKGKIKNVSIDDITYSTNNVYIVHNNDIEEELYNKFNLYNNYELPLIPKGKIARLDKELKKTKYKILPQNRTKSKNIGYWQVANIATPTRYQGAEVEDGRTLYYCIDNNSIVFNREWYTVISRLHNIENLVVVNIQRKEKENLLLRYNNKKIKIKTIYTIEGKYDFLEKEDKHIAKEDFNKLNIPYDRNLYYDRTKVWYNGRKYTTYTSGTKQSNKITISSLLKRECDFDYNMASFLKKVSEIGKDIELPCNLTAVRLNLDEKNRDKYQFALDLKASYPHILNFAKLPINRNSDIKVSLYLSVKENSVTQIGRVITDSLYNILSDEDKEKFTLITEYDAKIGSEMGTWLYNESIRCIESAIKIKDIHYGFVERQYLSPIEYNKYKKPTAYVANPENNHGLLMMAIKSEQLMTMIKCKQHIYNDITKGYINADCIYFNTDKDINILGDELKTILYPYDFRIQTNDKKKEILYKTYEELKPYTVVKAEREKERRKRLKAERLKNA